MALGRLSGNNPRNFVTRSGRFSAQRLMAGFQFVDRQLNRITLGNARRDSFNSFQS
ncbi:MAG: hypothetical protein ACKVOJ_10560 [Sphingomonadaceae bacterium]